MRKFYLSMLAVCLTILAQSQNISIDATGVAKTENFNTLAISGTSSTVPTGWFFTESGTNANAIYSAGTGSSNSGDTYSFGAASNTERAFGTLQSGSLTATIGAGFTNNTNAVITSVTISYTGEMWRVGVTNHAVADRLDFQYSTSATAINAGTFTDVDQLDFSSPIINGTAGALDGNVAANRTTITYTITGLNIAIGATFFIRWTDFNVASNDDGLAIDDFSLSANGSVAVACVAPTAQPTALTFSGNTTSTINGSFTAASPVADQYLVVRSINSSLGADPIDATVYNTGDAIGNGTVVSVGSGTSFSDGSLNPATVYYYFVYALNNSNCTGGPLYFITSPLTTSSTTATPVVCASPTGTPSNVQFTSVSGSSISGSFTAAADADGYLVCISTAPLVFTPVDGTTYTAGSTIGNGTVVDFTSGTTFSKTGLAVSTQYYFTFFAVNSFTCTGGPLYNTAGTSANTTTTAGGTGIPAAYYSTITSADNCATLKSKLSTIISANVNFKTYGDLYTQYAISDIKPREVGTGSANVIWDIYSDKPGPANDPYNFTPVTQEDHGACSSSEGSCYNREHSVPLSWFGGSTGSPSTGATDYNFIFPTDKQVNADRSNYIYGEVAGGTSSGNGAKLGSSAVAGISGTVFEPINEYKGDVARAFLYFVTRYQSNISGYPGSTPQVFNKTTNGGTFPSVEVNYLKVMLKWASQDPVSQKEIDRNNAAYSFQNNRNPYIDHPEYVDLVWNNTCTGLTVLPVDILLFKGNLIGSNVQLQWEVGTESNLAQYEIERSANGTDYTKVGAVMATGLSNYSYADNVGQLTGRRLYYRIKKVDKDGKFAYSAIFSLHVPLQMLFNVYPNPVTGGNMTVQLGKAVSNKAKLMVVDAVGKIVLTQNLPATVGSFSVNTSQLPSGSYLVRLLDDGQQQVQKILVVK